MIADFLSPNAQAGKQDELILDICELERLVQRINESLQSVDPQALPPDLTAQRLMVLLSRADHASFIIQETIGRQFVAVTNWLAINSPTVAPLRQPPEIYDQHSQAEKDQPLHSSRKR